MKNEIRRQETRELVNPMTFNGTRPISMEDDIEFTTIYNRSNTIFNNILSSDEIYNKRGKIDYSISSNIHDLFNNRIIFIIKNAYFEILENTRVRLSNKKSETFKEITNQICIRAMKLFSEKDSTLEYQICNKVYPLTNIYNDGTYSLNLMINNIVEVIYNLLLNIVEETLLYYKIADAKLTKDQYETLYNIPNIITFNLGCKLGGALDQFETYKKDTTSLIDPESLKYDDDEY